MWNRKRSVTLSIIVCFAFAVLVALGIFFGPWAVTMWFTLYRGWDAYSTAMHNMLMLFCACYYPCAVFAYVALYSLIRMLFHIKQDRIFIKENVQYLRRISWCCFAVAFATALSGVQYLPFFCAAVAAAFMGLMLRVVKNVMENAVELKTENELTI